MTYNIDDFNEYNENEGWPAQTDVIAFNGDITIYQCVTTNDNKLYITGNNFAALFGIRHIYPKEFLHFKIDDIISFYWDKIEELSKYSRTSNTKELDKIKITHYRIIDHIINLQSYKSDNKIDEMEIDSIIIRKYKNENYYLIDFTMYGIEGWLFMPETYYAKWKIKNG